MGGATEGDRSRKDHWRMCYRQASDRRAYHAGATKFLDRRDGFDLEELLEIEHFGRRMRCERQELSIRLEDLEAKRAEAQEEFLEASRKRKVLEKLKERKAEIHRKQELAVQQRSLDEIGSSLSVRVRQGR